MGCAPVSAFDWNHKIIIPVFITRLIPCLPNGDDADDEDDVDDVGELASI